MKLSVISDQISDAPETAFRAAKEAGYDLVELHNINQKTIEELDDTEVAEIKRLLETYELQVSNLATTVYFVCPLYPTDQVSGFNEAFHIITGNRDAHLRHLKRACEIAEELNCPSIRLFPFRFPDNRKPPFGGEKDRKQIVEAMIEASRIAADYPVVLAVENCPYSHLPKGQMTLEMIQEAGCENLRLLYDPANSYRAVKENVPERYLGMDLMHETELTAPYIAHVHIKNYHYDPSVQPKPFLHVPSGDGDINYAPIFQKLQESGYQGAVSLEPEVDLDGTMKSMKWMKDLAESMGTIRKQPDD